MKKPLVVVAGQIHRAGMEILEAQADVVVPEESFEGVIRYADQVGAIATFVCTEIVKVLRGEPPSAVANPEVLPKL